MGDEPGSVEPETLAPDAEALRTPGHSSWAVAGVVMLIAGSAAYWMIHDPPAAAPEMSPDLAARYERAFASAHSGLMPVDLSTEQLRSEVAISLPVEQGEARRLVADAVAGKRALGAVRVWDNMVEDGDVVRLTCHGLSVVVTLTKKGATFVFPYEPGDVLVIEGVRDGDGGGITAAVEVAAGPIPLPAMRPGESRSLRLF